MLAQTAVLALRSGLPRSALGSWPSSVQQKTSRDRPLFARCLLVATLLLAGFGLTLGTAPGLRLATRPGQGDVALYRAIQGRMAQGDGYYRAVAVEHRVRHYPLRPFVAVRPPALAEIMTLVGGPAAALWLLRALGLVAIFATARRLAPEPLVKSARLSAVTLLALTLAAFTQPALIWWHELWAGLLVLLAVMLRKPGQWRLSLAVGLAAGLIREFALLLPVVMAGWALIERQRREAIAWAGTLGAGLLALGAHALLVSTMVRPADPWSPGWVAGGGWAFVLSAARSGSLLLLVPAWVAAVAVPCALFGWTSWTSPLGRRIATLLVGWGAVFLLIGRPDNAYWGLLLGPMLTMGLALVPQGLRLTTNQQRAATNRFRQV